jgi:hypothetical protein
MTKIAMKANMYMEKLSFSTSLGVFVLIELVDSLNNDISCGRFDRYLY